MNDSVYSLFDRSDAGSAYYFFHIPKTAGSSLTALVQKQFADSEVCPVHLWDDLLALDREQLQGFRLYRGHFYAMLDKVVRKPLRGFVFLRDPIERALSHYSHVMVEPDHYLHRRAHQLGTVEAYLLDPVTRETVRNFQAKSLVAQFDPLAPRQTPSVAGVHAVQKAIELATIDLSDEELSNRAQQALRHFSCIGLTERFEESVRLLNRTFGWTLRANAERINVNGERRRLDVLTGTERALLESLNSVDQQLYSYACNLFDEMLARA